MKNCHGEIRLIVSCLLCIIAPVDKEPQAIHSQRLKGNVSYKEEEDNYDQLDE